MKNFDLDEAVSISHYRDDVMNAVEEATRKALSDAVEVHGSDSVKVGQKVLRLFPLEFDEALERAFPIIKKVHFVDDVSYEAAVDYNGNLMIPKKYIEILAEWAAHGYEVGGIERAVKEATEQSNWLAERIVHELVHLEQHSREPRRSKSYTSYLAKSANEFFSAIKNLASREDWDMYHASPQEIPAFAHQMIYKMITQALQGKRLQDIPESEIPYVIQELRDLLKDVSIGIKADDDALTQYLNFKGPDKRRMMIFKRFMKAVYQEVQSYIQKLQTGYRGNKQVNEIDLTKNQWETILSTADKEEIGDDLVQLVQTAYSKTDMGSFINSIQDVLPSDWKVLNWDKDPSVDCALFYRGPRGTETWSGFKIQGLGHDGRKESKSRAIQKIISLLQKSSYWIECNGVLRNILKSSGVNFITDEKLLQRLFNDPNLKMISDDSYVRTLPSGEQIEESVAGNPVIKNKMVDESFDKPLPWHKSSTSWGIEYTFTTPKGQHGEIHVGIFNHYGKSNIAFALDESMITTGKGESLAIFSTVIDCVKNAIRDPRFEDIWEISFTAANNEPSRVKLYNRFAKILPTDGFEFIGYTSVGDSTKFVFRNLDKLADIKQSKKETIDESFNSSVDYEWTPGNRAVFTIGGLHYGYSYNYHSDDKILEIAFSQDGKMGITGTGNAQKVFATVIAITRELMSKLDVEMVAFSADEENRKRLYIRLLKTLLPDWKIDHDGDTGYIFAMKPKQVTETFDKPLAWRKRKVSWGLSYKFTTPEGKWGEVGIIDNGAGVAEIIFEVDGTTEATGGGEAIPIFATVIDCVKNALGDPKMDRTWKIQYGAMLEDPRRQKLYSRFAKILPQAGYEFVGTRDTNLYKEFEFVNPEKKKERDEYEKVQQQTRRTGRQAVRSRDQIEESLNQPYEFKKGASSHMVEYMWRMEDNRVGKCMFKLEGNPKEQQWGMLFEIGGSHSLTGQGNAFRIFATVVACFNDWLATEGKNAEYIGFTADKKEPSRVKLYDRFARLLPRFGFKDAEMDFETHGNKFYEFVRDRSSQPDQGDDVYESINSQEIQSFSDQVKNDLELKRFDLYPKSNGDVELASLIVDKNNQRQGTGTEAMNRLVDFADRNNIRIILTPAVTDKYHGTTSRSRLVNFYKRFGFKENKGRYIDFAIGAGKMFRNPRNTLSEMASGGCTSSGAVAPVSMPLGGTIRRSGSSILTGINTAEETPNTPDWMKAYKKKNQNNKRSK